MKTSKLLGLLCALFFVIPAYAGFTDTTGLRWELPPNKDKITRASDADAICANFKIGNRPSRLPTMKEVRAFQQGGHAALTEAQRRDFDSTRSSVGEGENHSGFQMIAKTENSYWNASLRTGTNRALGTSLEDLFSNTRVICVANASAGVTKNTETKSPAASAKAQQGSAADLGPVLTRVETKPSETKKLAAEAVERNKKEAVERATKRKADQAVAAKAQASKDEQTKQRCLTTPSLRGSCGCMKYFPDVKADVCGK